MYRKVGLCFNLDPVKQSVREQKIIMPNGKVWNVGITADMNVCERTSIHTDPVKDQKES